MITKYLAIIEKLFLGMRFSADLAKDWAQGVGIITLLVVGFGLFFLAKWLLKSVVGRIIRKSPIKYDDYFLNKKLERRIALLIPIYLTRALIYDVAPDFASFNAFALVLIRILEITTFTGIFMSTLNALSDIYNSFDVSKNKPIKGLIQVIKIILVIICVLLIIAVLTQKDLGNIFIGLGTLSAVLMLVFKDPPLRPRERSAENRGIGRISRSG